MPDGHPPITGYRSSATQEIRADRERSLPGYQILPYFNASLADRDLPGGGRGTTMWGSRSTRALRLVAPSGHLGSAGARQLANNGGPARANW